MFLSSQDFCHINPLRTNFCQFYSYRVMAVEGAIRDGLTNDRIHFLKVLILSEFLIVESNLFHSVIVEGKKVFLKKSCFTFITGILLHYHVRYDIFCIGVIE